MKRLLLLLPIFFFITTARSQNITAAEYFIDTDPGRGNGVPVTISTPADIVSFTANVSTTSLSSGFHFVAIRTKDANGVWGLFETRGFYISNTTTNTANLTAAEYFIDTDPGPGNGTPLSVGTTGAVVNFTAIIPTSLPAGFHFIAIRTKNADGIWGSFETRGFYISSSTTDAANITAAEYFLDTDPGPGNGISISVGTTGSVVNFSAAIPTSLPAGFHFIAIRTKGTDGKWGLFETRGFYISSATTDVANIVAAEYFLDSDPGPGNGTPVSVGTTGSVVNFSATIPTSLPAGFHFIAIRVKGQDGQWGLYEQRGFYISSATTDAANITAAEYFFDADPGPGNGTPVSVGTTGGVVNFTATIPTSLPAGFHFITIRVKGQDGKWGMFEQRGFYISTATADAPIITAAEYFFDADPGAGNGTPLTITTPGNIVTQTFNIPEPSLALGNHFLAIRVKGQDGKWGLYEHRQFAVGNSTITCPSNVTTTTGTGQCTTVVNNIDPVVTPAQSFTYTLSGATTGTGSGTASGQTFNAGVTTVQYILTGSPTVNCSFTVTVNASVVPSVTIAASATTICTGTNVTFTATPANGGATPLFQWKLNGINVGTNNATYQNASLSNNDVVTVVMTSSISCASPVSASSNAITMTVSSTATPSVNIAASATTICSGVNVIFTATPTNGGTPSFQWKLNGTNVGTNNATYQNAGLINGDIVSVVMTSSLSCVTQPTATSNNIVMTVNPAVAPSVSIAASATTICSGANVIFTATPANGGTPSFQWKLNGSNVGTNSTTYQNATLANNDVVTVVMNSSLACAVPVTTTSNAITMAVTTTATPSVTIAASATTICSGVNVIFTATPTNGGTPSYQWKLNGANVGTNSATYQNTALANGDLVSVAMTSSLSCVTQPTATSNNIAMTVNPPVTPSVSIAASATTICSGTNVTFTATPVNGGTPSFQWKLNGTNVGTNSTTYQNAGLVNNDIVTVVLTSSAACANPVTVTSNPITMTVTSPVTPTVTIAASATTICSGTNVTFTATPTNGGTPSFQWKLNGTNVGTNSATYQNATLANNNVITVVLTSSLTCVTQATATSNAIAMNVVPGQTWIGVTSTNWNTASNWCGGVPSATTDVVIPSSAPNMPNLNGGTGTARNITINTGGTMTIAATGILDLFGSVTNNGTFNATAGSINFRGTASQSMPAFTANNITMNGSGGVVLNGNTSITGSLTLTNGHITLGANNLLLITGSTGSAASHIITNGNGNVIMRNFAAGNTRTIPVAVNAATYNPAVIIANTGHITDDISVRIAQGVFVNGTSGNLFTDKVVDKTWIIDEAVQGGSNVNVTLQWTASQELTNFSRDKCYVTQNIGGSWQTPTATAANGTDPFTQTKTNVTGFSPFAVETTPLPKPIKGIYPNPVAKVLNIVTDLAFADLAIISIYDATGRLAFQQSVAIGSGLNQTSINVEKLSAGVYMLKISGTMTSRILSTRFVKVSD